MLARVGQRSVSLLPGSRVKGSACKALSKPDAASGCELGNASAQNHPATYRPAVDGLRAVAVVAVILNHLDSGRWPGGYLGVDVFFVISGFVVALSLLGRNLTSFGPFILGFYSRRVRRLLPALLVTILISSVVAALFMYPGSLERITSLQTGMAAVVGGGNLYLMNQESDYFGISSELNLFLHTWSLGVEEQFYLVFPILWILIRLAGKQVLAAVIALLCVCSLWLQSYYLHSPNGFNASFYLMPSRFWELGLGVLAALSLPLFKSKNAKIGWVLSRILCPLSLLWLLSILVNGSTFLQLPQSRIVVLLTAVLFVGLEHPGPIVRLLSTPILLALGLRSYGLYLWHWPLFVVMRWTLGLTWITGSLVVLLTVLLAWASYRWIESPLRWLRWRPNPQGDIAIGIAGAGIVASGLGLLISPAVAQTLWLGRDRPVRNQPPPDFPHLAYAPEVPGTSIKRHACFERFSFTSDIHLRPEDLRRCRVKPLKPRLPTIYIYGDSFAGHLSPLLGALRRQFGVGLEVLIRAQCPFPARRSGHGDDCARFHLERRQRLLDSAHAGDVVLLATSAREPGGRYTAYFLKELKSLVTTLKFRGVRVIFQSPLPRFPGSFDPVCVYPLQTFQIGAQQRCREPSWVSRGEELARIEPLTAQLGGLQSNGLEIWDAFSILCPSQLTRCSTHAQGARLYRDEAHLSARGAELLVPSLRSILVSDRAWRKAVPAMDVSPASPD